MDKIEVFKNDQFGQLRTLLIDNKPYVVAIDVARALGYKNPNKAVKDHCRWVTKQRVPHPQSNDPTKTIKVNCIPEGDIYRLITHSELPDAEKFESWVFDEVLPTIRRHGAYMTPQKIEEILLNPDTIIDLATRLKEEQALVQKQKQIIGELRPKADYTDRILRNKGLVTITQIAKDYGMSGQAMNSLLHELGVQYKQSNQWLLYSKHQGKGYTHSETVEIIRKDGTPDIKMNTKWTQKGRLFLYDLLKEHGVLPVIEQDISDREII
jgi:anti-repressor protein